MNRKNLNITSLQNDPKFKKMNELGLIDEIALRNLIIKEEYKKLRKTLPTFDAIAELSEKHNLSDSAINSILFRKRIRKKVLLKE